MDAIDDIDLSVSGVSSLILRDLSEYVTLPFLAAFDVPDAAANGSTSKSNRPPQKRVTYIALSKRTMPQVVKLFLSFKEDPAIYNDGTAEAILAVRCSFSVPYSGTEPMACIGVFDPREDEV